MKKLLLLLILLIPFNVHADVATPITRTTSIQPTGGYYYVFYVDGEKYSSTSTADGGPIKKPEDPQKEGYTFIKWVKKGNLDIEIDFNNPPRGAFNEIEAVFEKKNNTETTTTQTTTTETTKKEKPYNKSNSTYIIVGLLTGLFVAIVFLILSISKSNKLNKRIQELENELKKDS